MDGCDSRRDEAMFHREVLDGNNEAVRATAPITKISQNLYVGEMPTPHAVPFFTNAEITHMINVSDTPCRWISAPYDMHHISTRDDEAYPILELHLDEFIRCVDAALSMGGTVLVHCQMGINRSVALCVAYMITRMGFGLFQAIRHIRRNGRMFILQNGGFRKQLWNLAAQ